MWLFELVIKLRFQSLHIITMKKMVREVNKYNSAMKHLKNVYWHE